MKTFFTILFLVANFTLGNAQNLYGITLTVLAKSSEIDFKDLIGKEIKSVSSSENKIYDTKLGLGIGAAKIMQIKGSKAALYVALVDFKQSADLQKAVKDFAKTYFSPALYDIEERINENGNNALEVYEKSTDNIMLEAVIEKDLNGNPDQYILTIFSKTAQKL